MISTITVKRMWVKPGTSKKGQQYTLTKLLGTDGNYYTTFQETSIVQSISMGSTVMLEAHLREGNKYDITRIESVRTPRASEQSTTAQPELVLKERLHTARKVLAAEFGVTMDQVLLGEHDVLLTEVLHQIGSIEWLGLEKAKQGRV